MKIVIGYPPLLETKGTALLSQNRQFQWFHEPTYIYPMVPSYAATLLKEKGFDVTYIDSVAERISYEKFLQIIDELEPDVFAFETKTPVIKQHWKVINELKRIRPDMKIVIFGDHPTVLPRESLENSKADFILCGGDFDFLLSNLVEWLEKKSKPEPGIWYRDGKKIKNTGKFRLNHDLNELPFIDRELTKWWLYAYENGNFKKIPGTYTMVGRDCWHRVNGGCTFCAWTTLYPVWRVRKPESLINEIGYLIENYGVKTVFDDTGTFPVGPWLKKFCKMMINRGYNRMIDFSCNMRFGALTLKEYRLMKKAGFRMLLFGLESANQKTLDKINKNLRVEQIIDSCKKAKQAGLEPHLTIMLGYPWETREEAWKTFELAKYLFEKGWADTLQATMVIPYPGTRLFEECKDNGLLVTLDWNNYDMQKLVMKCGITEEDVKKMTQRMYKLFFNPKYMFKKLVSMRSFDDLDFFRRGIKKIFGHIQDFSAGR